MPKKNIVAMILAGGQGSRLKALTQNIAKPAVAFGGKYKIIDFVLSNCANSGIDTIGILTQYKPWLLNKHIGIGKPWDLDVSSGGVSILSPYMDECGGEWYKGTADAIYQNLHFLDSYDPEYVLILSGDHIYKMDYTGLLDFHKQKNADATISVINVPLSEAGRFGIMNTNSDLRISEFEEKPQIPKSTLASMGIYIFNYKILKDFLKQDANNSASSHDFGKDIIPQMIKNFKKLYAYPFEGYWRDIGTVDSFYKTNIELLKKDTDIDLYDSKWKYRTKNPNLPPQYIGQKATVTKSIISEGSVILGDVTGSVIFPGTYIGEGCYIKNSIILEKVRIEAGTAINNTIVGYNATIGEFNDIGTNEVITLIEDYADITSKTYCMEDLENA